jgi:hypothetical protein
MKRKARNKARKRREEKKRKTGKQTTMSLFLLMTVHRQ